MKKISTLLILCFSFCSIERTFAQSYSTIYSYKIAARGLWPDFDTYNINAAISTAVNIFSASKKPLIRKTAFPDQLKTAKDVAYLNNANYTVVLPITTVAIPQAFQNYNVLFFNGE